MNIRSETVLTASVFSSGVAAGVLGLIMGCWPIFLACTGAAMVLAIWFSVNLLSDDADVRPKPIKFPLKVDINAAMAPLGTERIGGDRYRVVVCRVPFSRPPEPMDAVYEICFLKETAGGLLREEHVVTAENGAVIRGSSGVVGLLKSAGWLVKRED